MSKNLLLIDDKEEFKIDFKSTAQRKGYGIAWGKSYEDLVEKLPKIHLEITAIILDIKCLMTNDQEIERADFIGSALNFLNREFPDIPRMILTGDEKALETVTYIHQNDEDIYKKEPQELDRLFLKLDEHNLNHANRILTFREKEILGIIQNDEGKHLEYKSSVQYCVKNQIKNKELQFEILKNLAAFANSEGGELLIGVDDEKNIIGLEHADFLTLKNDNKRDAFRLMFDDLIQSNFGNDYQMVLADFQFYQIKEKTVCRIIVKQKHGVPVFFKKIGKTGEKYDSFYIRAQASARELKGDDQIKYIESHWN
ncbi:helix-turn-helix domain-containing protein [Flavobacterium aquidurense]|uniref:AlbA family DNA-binding domain-containing protein n=1 Tax=Flavobacterium aquidurense TaxID=362413 RepID=UPI003756D2A8